MYDDSLMPAFMFDGGGEGDGADVAALIEDAAARSFPATLFSVVKGEGALLEIAETLGSPIYSRRE
jgi:hypothetical protein